METRYNIYFAGQLLEGQDLATVRDKLAKLFNADQPTLDKLFSGKAQLLKRDCDKATALKYQQAIERAGGQPIVKANQESAATPPPTPIPEKTMTAAQRIAALAAAPDESSYRNESTSSVNPQHAAAADTAQHDADQEGLNLAPTGADVLRDDERTAPVISAVDTSGLEIDAAAMRLSEEPPPPPAAPDTSHLDMGSVGEMIPNLPSAQVPVTPDIDAIKLSPEGTDFADCAPPEPETPLLDLSALDIAPPGTDVLEEQYRNKEQSAAPPTDHLSLED